MRPIVQMKEQIDRLNDLQCNNWESMAEFSVGLEEDQDDIFLHCTRVTIDDRELLYLSEVKKLFEMVRTCPLVEFPSEYQDDIKKMKVKELRTALEARGLSKNGLNLTIFRTRRSALGLKTILQF